MRGPGGRRVGRGGFRFLWLSFWHGSRTHSNLGLFANYVRRLSTVIRRVISEAAGPDDWLHTNLNQFCEKQRPVAIGPWANGVERVTSGQRSVVGRPWAAKVQGSDY
jgi:hypothetical protein